jgi:hypothetical protein
MRTLVLSAGCLLLVAACDEPPPAATMTGVPVQYLGVWDASLADCETGGGPSRVKVAADELVFPDSRLAVTGALPDGEKAVRVDGELTTTMGGGPGSIRLELSDGGQTLMVVNGSTLVPRVKCP